MNIILVIHILLTVISAKIPIKALILPKFEVGELSGDFPGEAQLYYDYYIKGHRFTKYTITNTPEPLYVNNEGVALIVTLMGKAQSGQTVATVLADGRFDFKDTLVVSTGCAGSTPRRTVLGDVILGGVVIDHELGHGNDKEDVGQGPLFIRDTSYDFGGYTLINETLLNWAYGLTWDLKLNDTERSRQVLSEYKTAGLLHRIRSPKVHIGGILTGDNYWAGEVAYQRVEQVFAAYDSPYDYMITEMEDSAIGVAVKRAGLQNQYLIIRDSVDFDVPIPNTGSILEFWEETSATGVDYDWGIFEVARKNNFEVGKVIVNSWLLEKKGRVRRCTY